MRATRESSHNLFRSREVLELLGDGGRRRGRRRELFRHGSKQGRKANTSSHTVKTAGFTTTVSESYLHSQQNICPFLKIYIITSFLSMCEKSKQTFFFRMILYIHHTHVIICISINMSISNSDEIIMYQW